jgi:hypothetical protein
MEIALMADEDEHDKQLELFKICGCAGVPAGAALT